MSGPGSDGARGISHRPPARHVPGSPGRGAQAPHDDQVAQLTDPRFPPGAYPLVVVGSGPGALQLTYSLRRLGIEHAVVSQDQTPGGMFRMWPIFQRMLSWTKPFADQQVFIVGKQNSGFEIASGLLPWARQIVLASPSPTQLSVATRSLVGVRARYVQPYEDWALAGGVIILDASIEGVERRGDGFTVRTKNPQEERSRIFEVDDVIAATGFTTPLRDLPKLGVATFGQSRLPAQTRFWESATVRGIFFAGTIMQGSQGLRKHGIPSNSGAVQGYRYNARVLARHLAETRFGVRPKRPN